MCTPEGDEEHLPRESPGGYLDGAAEVDDVVPGADPEVADVDDGVGVRGSGRRARRGDARTGRSGVVRTNPTVVLREKRVRGVHEARADRGGVLHPSLGVSPVHSLLGRQGRTRLDRAHGSSGDGVAFAASVSATRAERREALSELLERGDEAVSQRGARREREQGVGVRGFVDVRSSCVPARPVGHARGRLCRPSRSVGRGRETTTRFGDEETRFTSDGETP